MRDVVPILVTGQIFGGAGKLGIEGEDQPATPGVYQIARRSDFFSVLCSIDTMNRLLAGEPNANSGNGWRIIDADTNMPSEGGYEPDVDYRAAYTAIWAG